MILVYTVTANAEEAEHIARLALEQKMCACANIIPGMRSMYWWQGKLEQSQECVLLLKTEADRYDAVEALVKKEHSYETPAIFSIPVDRVDAGYETWLKGEVG